MGTGLGNSERSFFSELKRRNVYRVGLAYGVASWLLLQVIDVVEPIIGLPEWVAKFVLVLLAVGLPLALVFSWAYEMTPEGLKREQDVDRSESITPQTGRRLDRLIVMILIAAVGIMALDQYVFRSEETSADRRSTASAQADAVSPAAAAATSNPPSIAVLPFMNMSADESSAYFSDGLADTLLHMLAQIREIRVAARTSSFQFRGQNSDITKIAEALNVGTVLEGSVQKAGNKIRITAQLIEAETGYHLWSGNFDRDLDDVFAVQDEIASEVVSALKVSLLGESAEQLARRETDNIDAYTEFLLGVNDMNIFSIDSLRRAEQHFLNAVQLDPEFALAWARLGDLYLTMQNTGIGAFSEMNEKAQDAATRALDIDSESSLAVAVLGAIENSYGNREQAEKLFQHAIELGPNDPHARELYANLLFVKGEMQQSLELLQDALEIDPLSANILDQLHIRARQRHDYDAARDYVTRIRTAHPDSPLSWYREAELSIREGNWAAAVPLTEQAFALDADDPELATMLGDIYHAMGQPDAATKWYERAVEVDPTHPVSRSAPVRAFLVKDDGDPAGLDLAWRLLEDKIEERHGSRLTALQLIWRHSINKGNLTESLERLRDFFPELFEEDGNWRVYGAWTQYSIGAMLISDGDHERGMRLIEPLLENSELRRGHTPYSLVHAWHLAGAQRREPLLKELALLREAGLAWTNWRWAVAEYPAFDFVRDEPEFREYVDWLESNAEEQRGVLLELRNSEPQQKRGPI